MKKLLMLALIISMSSFVYADEPEVDSEGTKSETQKDGAQKPQALAEEYGISADSVNSLKNNFKIGYGGVKHALALSSQTGLTPEEILKMKTEDKMGWGNIRKELGVGNGNADKMERKMDRQAKIQRKMDRAALKAEKRQGKGKGLK